MASLSGIFPMVLDRCHVSFLRRMVEILSLFRDLRCLDFLVLENSDFPMTISRWLRLMQLLSNPTTDGIFAPDLTAQIIPPARSSWA
jgi:hypothetical protein